MLLGMILACIQASLLRCTKQTSSSCTGALTSEMALAVLQRTINDAQDLSFPVSFQVKTVHDLTSVKDLKLCWSVFFLSWFKCRACGFPFCKLVRAAVTATGNRKGCRSSGDKHEVSPNDQRPFIMVPQGDQDLSTTALHFRWYFKMPASRLLWSCQFICIQALGHQQGQVHAEAILLHVSAWLPSVRTNSSLGFWGRRPAMYGCKRCWTKEVPWR